MVDDATDVHAEKPSDLPREGSIFAKAPGKAPVLLGVERRFYETLDGLLTLKEVAQAIGVNTLRAQFLAKTLRDKGAIEDVSPPTFDIPSLDDLNLDD